MIAFILKLAVSYLIGSVLGSLVLGRITGRADIRSLGSGNPGSTNALRTQGKLFALGVMIIDVGKGWVAARLIPELPLHLTAPPSAAAGWLSAACGAAVMVGHVYPLWFGFRGGKGVATFIGVVLGLLPRLLLPVLFTWCAVVVLTGFVGLASMAAALALPISAVSRSLAGSLAGAGPLLAFGIFAAALIVLTNRSNIARWRAGREPRARRLWLLGCRAASRT